MPRSLPLVLRRIGLTSVFGILLATVFLFVRETNADNWPQWRGPAFNGISTEKNLPIEWSSTKNVLWKLKLPGPAGASPVVWGERIFLTSVDGDDLVLICASTSGKELWRRTVGSGNRRIRRDEGNMASPSPTTDGKHVWAMMGTGHVACYDMNGKKIWKFNLQDRYGRFRIAFGMASTPIVSAGRLLFQLIHGDGSASTQEAVVVAVDAATGKPLWKTERITGASNENEHSYASPILYRNTKRTLLITHGADYTIAYDPSNGKEIWRCGGLNPQHDPNRRYHPTLRFVASPVAVKGLVIIPTAKRREVYAVNPDLSGDLTNRKEAHLWKLPRDTPDVPSPLIHNGLVYLCRENGNLMCLDAKTGKLLYTKRTHRNRHRSSPVYADGKIYLTARDGKVTVVQAGRKFKILVQNDIGETITASPAISNGTIYLRSWQHLWAIRK